MNTAAKTRKPKNRVVLPGAETGSFAADAKAFIMQLAQQQNLLFKMGYIRHDQDQVNKNMAFLLNQVTNVKYTHAEMAQFWARHCGKIASLLPGSKHVSHATWAQAFIAYNNRANYLNELYQHPSLNSTGRACPVSLNFKP